MADGATNTVATREVDIRATVLRYLSLDSTLTAEVPTARWLPDGAGDTDTAALADWLEPTLAFVTGAPSRSSGDARIAVDVGVVVRPGANIHRREEIANAVAAALANAVLTVKDYASGAGSTTVGTLRLYDPSYVNGGRVSGLHRGTVTVDGYYIQGD